MGLMMMMVTRGFPNIEVVLVGGLSAHQPRAHSRTKRVSKYRPDFFNLFELRCVDRRAKLTREKLKS